MKTKIKLIEKIEGEAKLHLFFKDDIIDFVEIEFFNKRGIENILISKPALDALVINPRVCGICGHAHLVATSMALESIYSDFSPPKNAKILREITLNLEIIQNHFKWFYLTIMPLLALKSNILKAANGFQAANRAIAIVGGQYPHNSYSIVGGVVCKLTFLEIVKLKEIIKTIIDFFEKEVVNESIEELINCTNSNRLFKAKGDLPRLINRLKEQNLLSIGKSYDRFIVFGANSYFKRGKSIKTRVSFNIDERFVKEVENKTSLAKNVFYKDKFYEVGALSRAMLNKTPLIKDMHRKFGDSLISRVVARVCEIPQLLNHSLNLIEQIDLSEPFYKEPRVDILKMSGVGVSSVEAARGSLIHKVELKEGIIQKYDIITPTQWNLSNGSRDYLGVAQKAIIGLKDEKLAEIVFKSFDVCSVCTTQ